MAHKPNYRIPITIDYTLLATDSGDRGMVDGGQLQAGSLPSASDSEAAATSAATRTFTYQQQQQPMEPQPSVSTEDPPRHWLSLARLVATYDAPWPKWGPSEGAQVPQKRLRCTSFVVEQVDWQKRPGVRILVFFLSAFRHPKMHR